MFNCRTDCRSLKMAGPVCFFSTLQEIKQVPCGPQRRDKGGPWKLISCQELKDTPIGEHLHTLKVYKENKIKSELDLVLWRSKQITLTAADCSSWSICPAHREELGLGWRTTKAKCQNVNEAGAMCKKAAKRGVNSAMVKIILEKDVFLQIGERKLF